MRLFVAIEIPDTVREAIAALIGELRKLQPQGKWVRAENLHVTLKFLGEVEPPKLSSISAVLKTIRSRQAIALEFGGLGFFPDARRPRIIWAAIKATDNLKILAGEIDRALHALGFPLEEREFTPHLTLARFTSPGISPQLAATVEKNMTRSFGSHLARQFHLIESKLKSSGAEYTTLQSFSFTSET